MGCHRPFQASEVNLQLGTDRVLRVQPNIERLRELCRRVKSRSRGGQEGSETARRGGPGVGGVNIHPLRRSTDGLRTEVGQLRHRGLSEMADVLESVANDHEQVLNDWHIGELTLRRPESVLKPPKSPQHTSLCNARRQRICADTRSTVQSVHDQNRNNGVSERAALRRRDCRRARRRSRVLPGHLGLVSESSSAHEGRRAGACECAGRKGCEAPRARSEAPRRGAR